MQFETVVALHWFKIQLKFVEGSQIFVFYMLAHSPSVFHTAFVLNLEEYFEQIYWVIVHNMT